MTESPFPMELDVESLSIRQMDTGEWELEMERPDNDSLYFYVDLIDPLYDQLCEQGEIEH